jgi:hypothetical protein
MNEYLIPKGRKSNLKKLIHYQAFTDNNSCNCIQPQKYLYSSNSATDLLPYNERISKIILTSMANITYHFQSLNFVKRRIY